MVSGRNREQQFRETNYSLIEFTGRNDVSSRGASFYLLWRDPRDLLRIIDTN